MKKKHVLIIVENLPVPLDRRVWQESCALRDMGYEVSVICPKMRGYNKSEELLDGIQIHRHWIMNEAKGMIGFLGEYTSALVGELFCALKVWRQKKFHVIHLCNPPDLLFTVALPFKIFAGVKVVFDVHDLGPEAFLAKFNRKGFVYWCVKLAEKLTLTCSDVVLATNRSVLDILKNRGARLEKKLFIVRTAPNKLNTTLASDITLKNGRKFLVGYIGVLGKQDGVDYLIKAADFIINTKKRNDVQFLIMGTGPQYDLLKSLLQTHGIEEYVTMPGLVTNEFLFTALKTMDLGVTCDPINDFNNHCTMNKVLEYMAFGKAQVMFGTVEGQFSAGNAAKYVMENSYEKLGSAIVDLLDDPQELVRLGELGYLRLKNELNWEKSVEQLKAAYNRALNG